MVLAKTQKSHTARTKSTYRHEIGNVGWNQVVVKTLTTIRLCQLSFIF